MSITIQRKGFMPALHSPDVSLADDLGISAGPDFADEVTDLLATPHVSSIASLYRQGQVHAARAIAQVAIAPSAPVKRAARVVRRSRTSHLGMV